MADLRIVDAPVLLQESITDDVKMPTGGLGNFSVRLGDILWYVITKEQLANKSYVDLSSKGVKDSLDEHIADKANPHNVTKAQVGLGNVDNTADVDKPVSNAVSSAIITATTDMATETYVNSKDGDLTTLTTTDKTNLVKAINELHDTTKGVVSLYDKNVATGAGANGWTTELVAEDGQTQRQINAATPQTFNTIADLKAFANAKNGQRVIVLGRNNTAKKLGGGIFVFDETDTTTAENGGTIFTAATAGRWKRAEDTDVCVSWFAGAADSTDKSADVQKAINYANALINAKALCVDDKYLITNTLKIDRMVDQTKGDFVIYSTGNNNGFKINTPITMFSSNNTVPAGSGYTRHPTCEFVTFKNVDFEAEIADVNNFVIDDLFLRSTFDKCTFRKMRLVKAVDYIQTLKWHGCKFRQHVDFLIDTRDAYDVHFNKCELENSGKGLRFSGIGRACHIDENLYQGSAAPFLAAAGFFSSSCDKNYFEANSGVDIDIGIDGGVSGGFTLNNNLWLLHDVSDVSFYPIKVGFANGFAMYGNTSNGNLCDNRFANPFAISEGANAARTTLAVNPKMAQSLVLGDSTNYDTATPIKTLTVVVSTATTTSGLALPKLADFKNSDKITIINYSDKVIKVYPAKDERILGISYSQANEQTGYGKVVNYIKSDSDFWVLA